MSEKSLKRKRTEQQRDVLVSLLQKDDELLENEQVIDFILKIARKKQRPIDFCYGCTEEIFKADKVQYLETSKWGYERPFCENCILECTDPRCAQIYCTEMAWKHDDCNKNLECSDDENDEESSEKQEKDSMKKRTV